MTKAITSRMVLVKSIVGSAYDIEGLNEVLTEYAKENSPEQMKELRILNVLHEVPRVDIFPLEKVKGELYFGDTNYPVSEGKFILHDYHDKEFTDEDDLKEFVRDEIKRGMLTIEEAKCLDFTYVDECKPDLEIEQEEDTWRLDVGNFEPKHSEAINAMGIEYIPFHEHEKAVREVRHEAGEKIQELQKQLEDMDALMQQKTPDSMSDDEISFEINQLEVRMQKLMSEQRLRKVAGYLNIKA